MGMEFDWKHFNSSTPRIWGRGINLFKLEHRMPFLPEDFCHGRSSCDRSVSLVSTPTKKAADAISLMWMMQLWPFMSFLFVSKQTQHFDIALVVKQMERDVVELNKKTGESTCTRVRSKIELKMIPSRSNSRWEEPNVLIVCLLPFPEYPNKPLTKLSKNNYSILQQWMRLKFAFFTHKLLGAIARMLVGRGGESMHKWNISDSISKTT